MNYFQFEKGNLQIQSVLYVCAYTLCSQLELLYAKLALKTPIISKSVYYYKG